MTSVELLRALFSLLKSSSHLELSLDLVMVPVLVSHDASSTVDDTHSISEVELFI